MPRIRTIKPDFWTDAKILRISPLARLLFIGMWNFADDNGVLEADPLQLKVRILPCDDIDISSLLSELQKIGLVVNYQVNGASYLWIKNFKKHQTIDRPRKSTFPPPPNDISEVLIDFVENQLISTEITIGKEKERKGIRKGKERGKERKDSSSDEELVPNGPPSCPHQEIIALYHEILPELPRVKEWGEERQKLLRKRWRESAERQNLDWWRRFFEYVKKCPFLMGQKTDFQANLEWLIRPKNFVKVIEGLYEERASPKLGKYTSQNLEAMKRFVKRGKND